MSVKISELPEGEDIFDGCCMPIVTNGETKKIYYATLKEKILAFIEDELADVAISGDYDDLTNKPTIPSLSGYATETYVNNAITAAIGSAIGGAY